MKDEVTSYWKEFTAGASNQLAVRGLNNIRTGEYLQSKWHKRVGRPRLTTANMIIVKKRGDI